MFYQTPDRIGGIVALDATNSSPDALVVATHDKHIRLVRDSDVHVEHRVAAPVATLSRGRQAAAGAQSVWYGSDGGGVGEVLVTGEDIKGGVAIDNPHHRQGVTAVTTADLSGSGAYDVIIGHDDGTFHLYPYSAAIDASAPAYTYELHESIVSLDAGAIHHPDSADLVVATYSGKVLTFGHDAASTSVASRLTQSDVGEKHKVMVGLQTDIDSLAKQVAMFKDKYTKLNLNTDTSAPAGVPARAEDSVAALPIKSSYRLSRDDACYVLSLEIPVAIDLCVLHCPTALQVVDASANAATVMSVQEPSSASSASSSPSSSPTMSPASPVPATPSDYINTIRLTSAVNRLSLSVRHPEGVSATLTAHVIPRAPPSAMMPRTAGKAALAIKAAAPARQVRGRRGAKGRAQHTGHDR